MAMIKIPQSLYVDIQVAAERMVPPVSATYLILTHLYKAFPPGAMPPPVPNLAPKLTSYNTNTAPSTQTSEVSEPSDAGLKYAPGDLRNTMSNEEIKEYMRSIFAKKAPADD